jgi:hypothetical protein
LKYLSEELDRQPGRGKCVDADHRAAFKVGAVHQDSAEA